MKSLTNHVTVVTAVRLAGLGLSLTLSVILGRWLGPTGFGGYTYLLSWISVFGMIGTLGLDRLLIREVSLYTARSDWRKFRGLLTWSATIVVFGASLMAAITQYNPEGLFVPPASERDLLPIIVLLVLVYPFFLVQLASLRGLGRVSESNCIESVLIPAIMLSVVIAYAANSHLTLYQTLTAHLIALGAATGIVFWSNLRAIPKDVLGVLPSFEHTRWLTSAGSMLILSGLNVVSSKIDCLLLGSLSGNEELGLYAAAIRGANLISFPFNMVVITIAPMVARFHAEGRLRDFKIQIIPQLRFALLAGIFIALVINFGSHWFFGLFGKDFEGGTTTLAILSVGQLFNIAAGPVACLLTMTHHERAAVAGIVVGTTVTGLSGLMLIAPYGSEGAAVASSLGLITWNLFMAYSVRRSLGIPISFWRNKKETMKSD